MVSVGDKLGETFLELLKGNFLINTTRIELKHDFSPQIFSVLNAHVLLDESKNLCDGHITPAINVTLHP